MNRFQLNETSYFLCLSSQSHDIIAENVKGIPYFWLTVFKNVEMLADMIQEHDEAIIKHLDDIRVKYTDKEPYVSDFSMPF